jgi:hypothetical protein
LVKLFFIFTTVVMFSATQIYSEYDISYKKTTISTLVAIDFKHKYIHLAI